MISVSGRKRNCLHADAAIGVSHRDATGTNTKTETVTIDCPKPATVSASALALHLDCSRACIGKLEAKGVIQWQVGGFPLDQGQVALPAPLAVPAAAIAARRPTGAPDAE